MRRTLLVLIASGCALPDADFDRDGWAAPEDCDDEDASVYPDAEEVVGDGVDQDCDRADILQRAAGVDHSCVLDSLGMVACISPDPSHGQLDVPAPHPGARFVQIAAGDFHTCALEDEGSVACWGDDSYGQSSPPINGDFVWIGAGGNASFGELSGGSIACWGNCVSARPLP